MQVAAAKAASRANLVGTLASIAVTCYFVATKLNGIAVGAIVGYVGPTADGAAAVTSW